MESSAIEKIEQLKDSYEETLAQVQALEQEINQLDTLQSELPQTVEQAELEFAGQLHRLKSHYRELFEKFSVNQKRVEEALTTRLQIEQTLSVCSQILLANIEKEEALTETLFELLVATGVSRVYLCENYLDVDRGLCMRQTHEIRGLDITSRLDDRGIQNLPYASGFSRWRKVLAGDKPIYGLVENLPDEERSHLQSRAVLSIVVLPIWVEGHWYGTLTFEDLNQPRRWYHEDIQWLQTVANMIGSYIGRKYAERLQRESEEKYRTLIEQSSDAIFLIYGGRFELVNEQFTELFGVTQEQASDTNFHFTNIVASHNKDLLHRLVRDRDEGKVYRPRYEFTAIDKNGNEIMVELTVSYPMYKRGLATQGILRDITSRKRMEEENFRAYEKVQSYADELAAKIKEEQRQREIATILAEVVASVSLTLSPSELLEHILIKLQQLVPYDAAAVYLAKDDDLVMEAASGAKADFTNNKMALDHNTLFQDMQDTKSYILIQDTRQDDRPQFWFGTQEIRCWIGAPLLVAQQIIGYLAVNRHRPGTLTTSDAELTQAFAHQVAQTIYNAQLYTELQEAQARLIQRERLAALGQMSATVAHELRNPLMALKMATEYLISGLDQSDPHQRGVDLMRSNMARIERVVENILFVSRAPRPSLAMGSLRVILENELPQWEPKLAEKNIIFHCDLAADLPHILIDFDQMGRSVSNLIANSIDALEANGTLHLSLHQEKDSQVIVVADNGPGILPDIQLKIFEPFFTTKSRGTGLGLAIVKQIIEYHHGTISVWSEGGKGTKFTIKLPVQRGV